eukprot:364510-Chlamydomonas_euryale.AAC.17
MLTEGSIFCAIKLVGSVGALAAGLGVVQHNAWYGAEAGELGRLPTRCGAYAGTRLSYHA